MCALESYFGKINDLLHRLLTNTTNYQLMKLPMLLEEKARAETYEKSNALAARHMDILLPTVQKSFATTARSQDMLSKNYHG